MDPRGLPMYQHPRMTMTGQSYIGSVPGSIPLNIPMGNPAQETMGMSAVPMSENHATLTHKTHHNKMTMQQNYSQLPIRKEIDDEGRICGVVLPETPAQLSIEGNDSGLGEVLQEEIKTEEQEDISYFMESSHDIFLKIRDKEITIKAAADILERKYSFVYTRYQEFCDNVSEEDEPKKKKTAKIKKKGKKKRRPKRLTSGSKPKTSGKIFKCEECPGIFYTEYQIKAHSKLHEEDSGESHTCTVCGVIFAKLFQLMRHRIEVHEEALQCPHCDSTFTVIPIYRQHIRSHTGVKPYECKECGQGFYSKFDLEVHIRRHTGERPFMCGYCEKTFTSLKNLKGHQYVHTGRPEAEKVYECKHCDRKYEKKNALEEHMNIHTGAKPYHCDMCDGRFNFKAGLERHKMTHTGVQPYKCDLCPAAFYTKKDIEQHKVVHTGFKAFKCDLCDYSCSRKYTLEYHKYTHTGETPFKCDFYGCTAEYAKPGSLRHHKMQHGQPPKICKVCHEKFRDLISLKRHMMIHTGEKLHTCEQCSKTFVEASSLKRHMNSHIYRPPGTKTKQVRQSRKNPVVKRVDKPEPTQKNWVTEYQVPTSAENGHNLFAPSLIINAEDTSSQHSQPTFHPYTAVSQYSNLINNSWPSAMDPDELRRRLLNSFK